MLPAVLGLASRYTGPLQPVCPCAVANSLTGHDCGCVLDTSRMGQFIAVLLMLALLSYRRADLRRFGMLSGRRHWSRSRSELGLWAMTRESHLDQSMGAGAAAEWMGDARWLVDEAATCRCEAGLRLGPGTFAVVFPLQSTGRARPGELAISRITIICRLSWNGDGLAGPCGVVVRGGLVIATLTSRTQVMIA